MSLQEKNRLATFRLQKVFSLTLILFVIVLSIVSFDYVRAKVRDKKRKADLRQINAALNIYYDKYHNFPEAEDKDWAGWDATYEPAGNVSSFLDVLYEKKIIDFVPTDPVNNEFYHYRYKKYPAGVYGCKRSFYVLQIVNFEGNESNHGRASCPEQDFVEWAQNGYSIQVFE